MKNQKTQFVYLVIGIRTSEYEFTSRGVHEISNGKNIETFSQKYVKTFYGDKPFKYNKSDNEWYFFGGDVCAWVDEVRKITKEEYDTLKQFGM